MTIDEILAQVYNEQGFLIMASIIPYKIGEIHNATYARNIDNMYPVRCIGLSTKTEFLSQLKRMSQLDKQLNNPLPDKESFFYRVEPTD